jgi:sugar lactone lactonase YvrE
VAGRNGNWGAPTPGPATSSDLYWPRGVAVDSAGNLYIADTYNDVVEKVTPSGTLSVVAGTGSAGPPTPGPATSSDLYWPSGVAVDAAGNLHIADTYNDVVEKVTPSGTLSVVAGTGSPGAPTPTPATSTSISCAPSEIASTPGPATASDLCAPSGVAADTAGNLYIALSLNDVVEKVTPSGTLSVVAGTGEPGAPTPGRAASSDLSSPSGVAVDAAGNLYIADTANNVVEEVTPSGTLSVVAGTGNEGAPTPGPATHSDLYAPGGVAVDAAGNLYIANSNDVVRVTRSGTLSVVAGTGDGGALTLGPATSSDLNGAAGVAVDAAGNLYIVDSGNQVVEMVDMAASTSASPAPSAAVSPAPPCSTQVGYLCVVAGTGSRGAPTPGRATSSDLGIPWGVTVDAAGNLYIADGTNDAVEKVTPSGALSVVARPAVGGPFSPNHDGVAVDAAGALYIADDGSDVVEEVTPSGRLAVVAGTGSQGAATPGPATNSDLNDPSGVAVDGAGNLYIADSGNDVVEKVTPAGTLSVVAGTGSQGAPTPGPATSSDLNDPSGVAVDGAGNLYIADSGNEVVEKVTPAGMLSVVVGTGNEGAPTPGAATRSDLSVPYGVAVDAAGNLYIADYLNRVVEKVTPSGRLSVVAGTVNHLPLSPGPATNTFVQCAPSERVSTPGPATTSELCAPSGVAVGSGGHLYIADPGNAAVEMVALAVSTSVTPARSTAGGPLSALPVVGVGVAVVVLAGILVFLWGRRRWRAANGTVVPPAAGGPPSFTPPPSPPPSP